MGDFSLWDKLEMLAFVLAMLIVTSCVHEAGHAWAAWRLGDRRDYIKTRKNPFSFSHISLVFTIILPSILMLVAGLMMGGARPVQVRQALGPGRMALVAASGPAGNLLVGGISILFLAGLVHAGVLESTLIWDKYYFFALQAVLLNFLLAALNLIPIPPFDGSRIVAVFLPGRLREIYYGFSIPFIAILAIGFLYLYFTHEEALGRFYVGVLRQLHDVVLNVLTLVE